MKDHMMTDQGNFSRKLFFVSQKLISWDICSIERRTRRVIDCHHHCLSTLAVATRPSRAGAHYVEEGGVLQQLCDATVPQVASMFRQEWIDDAAIIFLISGNVVRTGREGGGRWGGLTRWESRTCDKGRNHDF